MAVINRKNIHTIDWNRGFETRMALMYTHTDLCVVFFCVAGGLRVGHSLIRVLQKSKEFFRNRQWNIIHDGSGRITKHSSPTDNAEHCTYSQQWAHALQYYLAPLTVCDKNVSAKQICKSFATLTVSLTDIEELKISHWWTRVIKFGLRKVHEDPEGKNMYSSKFSLT